MVEQQDPMTVIVKLTCVGPIVRIGPNELHVNDSDFFLQYNSANNDKDRPFYDALNLSNATVGTSQAELHRKRRAALNPYFSRGNIDAQAPIVQGKALLLCEQLRKSVDTKLPVRLDVSFESMTLDIVTQCAFGQSYGALGPFPNNLPRLIIVLTLCRKS